MCCWTRVIGWIWRIEMFRPLDLSVNANITVTGLTVNWACCHSWPYMDPIWPFVGHLTAIFCDFVCHSVILKISDLIISIVRIIYFSFPSAYMEIQCFFYLRTINKLMSVARWRFCLRDSLDLLVFSCSKATLNMYFETVTVLRHEKYGLLSVCVPWIQPVFQEAATTPRNSP